MSDKFSEKRGTSHAESDTVRAVAEAIDQVYGYSNVGGNLHLVVDDWNVEDDDLDFCADLIERNPHDSSEEQRAVERECYRLMRALTIDERAAALALHAGRSSRLGACPPSPST